MDLCRKYGIKEVAFRMDSMIKRDLKTCSWMRNLWNLLEYTTLDPDIIFEQSPVRGESSFVDNNLMPHVSFVLTRTDKMAADISLLCFWVAV